VNEPDEIRSTAAERNTERNTTQQRETPGRTPSFGNVGDSATSIAKVMIESQNCVTASQTVEAANV
jgi:hypothetical protein